MTAPLPVSLQPFVTRLATRRAADRIRLADWRGMAADAIEAWAWAMFWQEVVIAGVGLTADCPATLDLWRADTLPDFFDARDSTPPWPKTIPIVLPEAFASLSATQGVGSAALAEAAEGATA